MADVISEAVQSLDLFTHVVVEEDMPSWFKYSPSYWIGIWGQYRA